MNRILQEVASSVEGGYVREENDGRTSIVSGSSSITLSPLEVAQVERGLLSIEEVRAMVLMVLGAKDAIQQVLPSQPQRRDDVADRKYWLN